MNKLKIKCISKYQPDTHINNFDYYIVFKLIDKIFGNDILYYRPNKLMKLSNIKKFFFKKELKHKKIFVDIKKKNKNKCISKNNLDSNKIVNNPKSFNKKYR